jgi:hypothetical protein
MSKNAILIETQNRIHIKPKANLDCLYKIQQQGMVCRLKMTRRLSQARLTAKPEMGKLQQS